MAVEQFASQTSPCWVSVAGPGRRPVLSGHVPCRSFLTTAAAVTRSAPASRAKLAGFCLPQRRRYGEAPALVPEGPPRHGSHHALVTYTVRRTEPDPPSAAAWSHRSPDGPALRDGMSSSPRAGGGSAVAGTQRAQRGGSSQPIGARPADLVDVADPQTFASII